MSSRRKLLAVVGGIALAGCTSDSGESGGSTDTPSPTPTPTDSPTPTPTEVPDFDDDGVPNSEDEYPRDPERQKDSDDDGVADSRDEYPNDPDRQADTDGDGVADSFDDFPENSNYSELVEEYGDTIDLNEDYYQYYEFELTEPADLFYTVEVQGDIYIDVFLTDGTNFTYFEDGSEWEYYGSGSDFDTLAAEESFEMGTDRTYYLVVDHTDEGGAAPPTNGVNDRITVGISYTLVR